jgi:hypothetical protein
LHDNGPTTRQNQFVFERRRAQNKLEFIVRLLAAAA